MTAYFVKIVGMVVLSAGIDVILPSGRMVNFVRSMIALLLFFVIVAPIISFAKGNGEFSFIAKNIEETLSVDISEVEINHLKKNIKSAMSLEFGLETDVEIDYENENGVAKIGRVVIYMSKSDVSLNTNDNMRVSECVRSICGGDVEVVVIG